MGSSRNRGALWVAFAAGIAAMLAMVFFVPFPADTGTGRRLFFSVLIGGFAAYGAWSFAGLVPLAREVADWARGRSAKATPAPHVHTGPLPELSPARKAVVRRIVAALSDHGVFAPERPDPALLYAGIADWDDSVTTELVIGALCEADYYHPNADTAPFLGNLVMLDTKTEQSPDYLHRQIAELVRIAGERLDVADVIIDADWPPQGRAMPVRISMRVNGAPIDIAYAGDVKYHSTHIAVTLARALDAAQTGRRLAAMWTDQGFWISAIDADALDALNAALKRTPRHDDYWNWVAEWTPYAAGDMPAST